MTSVRRVALVGTVASVLLVSLVGCASDRPQEAEAPSTSVEQQTEPEAGSVDGQDGAQDTMTSGSEITAESVWTNELSSGDYREWETAPGHTEPVKAAGPHGATVQVYVNDEIAATIAGNAATEWPRGSVLVKDIFSAGGELQNVAYMLRTGDGWFYAEYGPSGTVIAEGLEIAACADCHAQGSDSVRTFELP